MKFLQVRGTTFFVMPPETTCSLDIEPPLSNWTAGDFTTYSDLSGSSGTVAQNPLYYGRAELRLLSLLLTLLGKDTLP